MLLTSNANIHPDQVSRFKDICVFFKLNIQSVEVTLSNDNEKVDVGAAQFLGDSMETNDNITEDQKYNVLSDDISMNDPMELTDEKYFVDKMEFKFPVFEDTPMINLQPSKIDHLMKPLSERKDQLNVPGLKGIKKTKSSMVKKLFKSIFSGKRKRDPVNMKADRDSPEPKKRERHPVDLMAYRNSPEPKKREIVVEPMQINDNAADPSSATSSKIPDFQGMSPTSSSIHFSSPPKISESFNDLMKAIDEDLKENPPSVHIGLQHECLITDEEFEKEPFSLQRLMAFPYLPLPPMVDSNVSVVPRDTTYDKFYFPRV